MKITIVGGGNMGLTYAKAFINSSVVTKEELTIFERADSPKLNSLRTLGVATISTKPKCLRDADLIILAVKPQDIDVLFEQVKSIVQPDQIVISIMAGVTIETIRNGLSVSKIVRAMPNLPAQIRHGITGFTCTDEVTRVELGVIQNLLSQTGKTLQVSDEHVIDVITAVSGSGPAYVFYFMDSMINAAMSMGFTEAEAELLVLETFIGSVNLFQQQSLNCKEWIQRVSSRGGTTEAAILKFKDHSVNNHIHAGMEAALQRAQQLGKK